ncbi:MAG: DUF1702 family protein [Thermoanaerobaculia bacterium]
MARAILGISRREVSFEVRGFPGVEGPARQHLETSATAFVDGYNGALEAASVGALEAFLESEIEPSRRGFAYEGAAMAVALQDWTQPWRKARLPKYMSGRAAGHVYIVHVGVGWAIARFPFGRERRWLALEPLYRWLALDGCGFHEAFFRPQPTVVRQQVPAAYQQGYARKAFDQGVGRALWFYHGGGVEGVARTVSGFPAERWNDLWSGVGLASAYAGGVSQADLERLSELAGEHRAAVAQGVVFAAKARVLAGNPTPQLELACRVFLDLEPAAAAALSDRLGLDLPTEGPEPAYEVWRQRIQRNFTEREGAAEWSTGRALSSVTR